MTIPAGPVPPVRSPPATMKPGARHVCAVLLAAWQALFAGANLASPEAYDVVLCDGRGTVQVQLVGSAGASFEINTADNSPILRVDDYAYAYEYGAKAQDPPGCSTYMYASVTDAGEVVASTQAVDSASDLGDHDYHADLRKMYTSSQAARSRRLDADEAAAAAAVPVPVPIPTSLPSGGRTVMRNLVVLVRFADHASRCLPSASDIDKLFNSDTYTYDAAGVPVRTQLALSPSCSPSSLACFWARTLLHRWTACAEERGRSGSPACPVRAPCVARVRAP